MTEPGERFLGSGLLVLAVAAGLCQFVLIGLLGVLLFPVGWVLLLTGGASARGREGATRQALVGGVVFLAGSSLLGYAAARASSLAYSVAIHRIHPGTVEFLASRTDWFLLAVLFTAAALLIAAGLRLRTGWSVPRVAAWAVAACLVCPVAVGMFFLLASSLPFTA